MIVLNWFAIFLIVIYQLTLSTLLHRLGLRCRHLPTCSCYAVMAFRKYGFTKAGALAWRRWRDCHPESNRPMVDYP